jgi:hypothetical protein
MSFADVGLIPNVTYRQQEGISLASGVEPIGRGAHRTQILQRPRYSTSMSKRPRTPPAKLYEWRIIRIKRTPAALVGYVNAPDKDQAIKKAIESFGVKDPLQQSRLYAIKVKEVSA